MTFTARHLGEMIKAHRTQKGITQEELASKVVSSKSRTTIALLEQGRRVPEPSELRRICEFLSLPERYWQKFAEEDYETVVAFEEAISELVGHPVDLSHLNDTDELVAIDSVKCLFKADLTSKQAKDWLNSLLVFYDVQPLITNAFFDRYIQADALKSPSAFLQAVRKYQIEAIRLFNSFSAAFEALNRDESFSQILKPLAPKGDEMYRERTEWDQIEIIENDKLPNLGYIAVQNLKKEKSEREFLATFLRDLANTLREEGSSALNEIGERKKRRIDSLLRQFNSSLPHGFMSPLFAADPDELLREANLLAPKDDQNLAEVASTQEKGLRNLARYLGADYLDVYVATSMRSDSDFISINNFVTELFSHKEIRPLKLRFFNPTQSWIGDRVAKGLVEALMLRRAAYTIYMAQNSDSFGKDSEASVALGQGQAVMVYVPKLCIPQLNIDTERLSASKREDLIKMIKNDGTQEDIDAIDDTVDNQDVLSKLLEIRLREADLKVLGEAALNHWADFSLYGEVKRIKDPDKVPEFRQWLDSLKSGENNELPSNLKDEFVGILIALAIDFEKRAKVFREIHPLALQVILSSGVLNGMIVVRSIDSCALILKRLIINQLDLILEVDENNYKLVESSTKSTIRVISRHSLISSAFSTYYAQVLTGSELKVRYQS